MRDLMINFVKSNKTAQVVLTYIGLILLTALIGKIFPTFAGTVLCLLLLGGYYGVLFRCLRFCNVNFLDILKNDLLRILLTATVGTGFIIFVISLQQTIYVWDSLQTWEPTLYCEETIFESPYQALKNLRWSINHVDYNNFLPMLMALPMHLFGRTFLCYELYVWLMFGLPGIFLASAIFKTILNNAGVKNLPCSAFMAVFIFLPITATPIFIGYANISILLPSSILLAMLLSLERTKLQCDRLIFIAVLCVFAVFQARTAVYMILGMFFGYTIYVAILGLREQTFLRDLLLLCQKFFVIGVSGFLITLPLFFSFIKHALTYDIGTAYSAYQGGLDFTTRLLVHASYLGFLIYALFIIGIIVSLRNKKLLPYALFFAAWFFTAELLICRIQLIGMQHNYTMLPPIVFMIAVSIAFALFKRKIFGAVLIFILAFNLCQAYSLALYTPTLFTGGYLIPVRHDIEDLKNFLNEINELTARNNKRIYFLASSGFYNSAIFNDIYLPEKHNALQNLIGTKDIDLRDGFPEEFFEAGYVVVTEPIQIHLTAQGQQTVVALSEGIQHAPSLSRHFKQIKEYSFSRDGISTVKFKIYEKISPYEKADIDFVEKYFDDLYPDHPDLFKNRFERYKREHFGE